MDYKEDEYIKSKFRKDDLISKNADDIFNKFINGEVKINDDENQNVTSTNENVIDMNDAKEKIENNKKNKSNKGLKKFFSAVASVAVVFVAANVYATTQGYDNIFFMIKDLIKEDVIIDNKEDILSDRDITISYETINILDSLDIQINRLVIEENKATLYVVFDENFNEELIDRPCSYKVYDVTNGKVDLLSDAKTQALTDSEVLPGSIYQEEIILNNFKKDTNVLMLDVFDKDEEKLISLKIDIENKQIDVVSRKEVAFEKISEVELKEVLSTYVALNYFKDEGYDYIEGTKEQAFSRLLVESAIRMIYDTKYKENNEISLSDCGALKDVHKALKEMTGKDFTNTIDLAKNDFLYFDKEKNKYLFDAGDSFYVPSLCLSIKDISYKNGVYEVNCIYCHPGSMFEYSEIKNMAQYETTFKLEINENYDYVKYRILNVNELKSSLVKESEKVSGETIKDQTENDKVIDKDEILDSDDKNALNNTNENQNKENISNEKAYVNGRVYEKELVEFLEDIVRINFHNDKGSVTHFPKEEYEDEMKILAALEISGKDTLTFEETRTILKEMLNENNSYEKCAHIVVGTYDNSYHGYISKNYLSSAKLYKILSIKEENGMFTAEVVYRQRAIDEEVYTVDITFVENKIYSYSKYKCLNVNSLDSKEYIINDDNLDNDTFAESMPWSTYATKSINVPVPEHFIQIEQDIRYDGNEMFGTYSFGSEGTVHGYNVDGVNAQDSEMKVSVYLEEIAENNTFKDYIKRVALRYNISLDESLNLSEIYYIDATNNKWFELSGEITDNSMNNYYCTLYKNNEGKLFGRVIQIEVTNPSERTDNYISYILGNTYIYGY